MDFSGQRSSLRWRSSRTRGQSAASWSSGRQSRWKASRAGGAAPWTPAWASPQDPTGGEAERTEEQEARIWRRSRRMTSGTSRRTPDPAAATGSYDHRTRERRLGISATELSCGSVVDDLHNPRISEWLVVEAPCVVRRLRLQIDITCEETTVTGVAMDVTVRSISAAGPAPAAPAATQTSPRYRQDFNEFD